MHPLIRWGTPIVIAFVIALAYASTAFAAGFGFYGTGGITIDSFGGRGASMSDRRDIISTTPLGGGILIDSTVARDRVFGNRLKIGVERPMALSGYSFEGWRAGARNAFGFGVKRTKNLRFWLGPQIGLHYLWGSSQKTRLAMDMVNTPEYFLLHPPSGFMPWLSSSSPFYNAILKDRRRYRLAVFEFGFVMGLNVTMGETFSLGLEWGGMLQEFAGKRRRVLSEALTGIAVNRSRGTGFGTGAEAYMNVAVIFRVKDTYSYGKTDFFDLQNDQDIQKVFE